MANLRESGPTKPSPSLGSSLGSAVRSVTSAVSKPRTTTGSGVSRSVSSGRSAVSNIGRSVSSSARRPSSSSAARSAYRAPTPPRVSSPRPPVGNTPSGTIARTVPQTPPPISIEDFLAKDTAYGSQKNAYQKALADYAAQMNAERGKYTGEYDAQVSQMGIDRTKGAQDLQDDFAGRGLLNSGVYGDALSQFNQRYDTQAADLERAKQAYMDDLTTGQTNFQTTQQTLLEKARQDAMNRRLDSLKV